MRLLVCLLVLLLFALPVYADGVLDGDRVVRKGRFDKAAQPQPDSEDGETEYNAVHAGKPLGMYFGSGDEFIESGAPRSSLTAHEAVPETQESKTEDITGDEGDAGGDGQFRSAILGARHKPPAFFLTNEGPESEESEAELAEHLASSKHDLELLEPTETLASAQPQEAVESSRPQEFTPAAESEESGVTEESPASDEPQSPDAVQELIEPVQSPVSTVSIESGVEDKVDDSASSAEPTLADAASGLARYSSYPAMRGKGKPSQNEAEKEPEVESDQKATEEPQPERQPRINKSNPDVWW